MESIQRRLGREAVTRRPVVSVVMAVYNGEAFLDEAVRSILGQTFTDFEFLIVNDGSTDRSGEILSAYGDPRIRVLDNPKNLGLTPSLNRGITAAMGEFIARLDADDVSEPQRLAKEVAFLRAHPEVGLVGSWTRLIDREGKKLGVSRMPREHLEIRWLLTFFCPFYHSTVLWRRQLVQDGVGMYSPAFQYAMDWELWVRIAAQMKVANIPEPLVRYRLGAHSMTSTHPAKGVEIRQARRAAAEALFGFDDARLTEWESSAAQTFQMIDGWDAQSGLPEIQEVVARVHELHDFYCRELRVPPAEARSRRKRTDRWMARMMLRSARHAHAAGRASQGVALARTAVRLDWGTLLSVSALRYWGVRLRR